VIIGICGLIGSGKDTIADYLVTSHGFGQDSFAASLKDTLTAVFGWDRTMLEGRTGSSRAWREQVDPWWADRLGIPHLTPRWVMQNLGTEIIREHFHQDIWTASVENKLRKIKDNTVISDCRFPNEVAAVQSAGGVVVCVNRGAAPVWAELAVTNPGMMPQLYPGVHASEYSWAGTKFDRIIDNTGSLDMLHNQVKDLVQDLRPATEALVS
jgi:hypothetical protein